MLIDRIVKRGRVYVSADDMAAEVRDAERGLQEAGKPTEAAAVAIIAQALEEAARR